MIVPTSVRFCCMISFKFEYHILGHLCYTNIWPEASKCYQSPYKNNILHICYHNMYLRNTSELRLQNRLDYIFQYIWSIINTTGYIAIFLVYPWRSSQVWYVHLQNHIHKESFFNQYLLLFITCCLADIYVNHKWQLITHILTFCTSYFYCIATWFLIIWLFFYYS